MRAKSGLCWLVLLIACSDDGHRPADESVPDTSDAAADAEPATDAPAQRDARVDVGNDADHEEPDAAIAPDAGLGLDAGEDAGAPLPPPLVFDPEPGSFIGSTVLVTLTAATDTAHIFYTTDGTLPTDASTPYLSPIQLSSTTLLRVAVYDDGLIALRSASYVQLAADVESFDSNLPLMIVHMLSLGDPDPSVLERVPAVAQLHDRDASGRASLLSTPTIDARIGIKVRGRSTRNQDKHSYTFEFRNQADEDRNTYLLDFPPQSDFVLYAPFNYDRAMLRNALFYRYSRAIGRYAPRTRFVEVFLAASGEPVSLSKYVGVYVITETIKRDAQRVPVEKLVTTDTTEPTISGGYIMRVDDPDPGETSYSITGIPEKVEILYPSTLDRNAEQTTYLTSYMNAAGRAFAAGDHTDPSTLATVDDLVDVDAFIDHHILNNFAKNPDAFRLSSYMHKPRSGKLLAGPLWDCDRCMGSYDGRDHDPHGWSISGGTSMFQYGWWGDLFADPAIETKYWARFATLLGSELSASALDAMVDDMAAELTDGHASSNAAERNATRWPQMTPRDGVFQNEIDDIKTWLDARVTWATANNGMR